MISHLAPNHYFDSKVFDKEIDLIFKANWSFAAFGFELEKNNDFVTLQVGRKPIVVQNFNGEIKAFLNVCSHRFSIIQKEKRGNRPLSCPYHGWGYSKDGVPRGIPKRPLFKDYSAEELQQMRLEEFTVEKCGSLIFIALSPSKSLREYLGSFFTELEHMSSAFGDRIDINEMIIESNWKVIVENTMEGYHLQHVHPQTLAQIMPPTDMENLKFKFEGVHSNYIIPLIIKENSKKLTYLHKPFQNRSWKIDGFIHYLVFPNLLISSSYGTTFNASVIEPVNVGTTRFTSNVFLSKVDEGDFSLDEYVKTVISYNRQVFNEDKWACELVQKGVLHTQQPGALSLEEKRVHHFQQACLGELLEKS